MYLFYRFDHVDDDELFFFSRNRVGDDPQKRKDFLAYYHAINKRYVRTACVDKTTKDEMTKDEMTKDETSCTNCHQSFVNI